MSDVERKPIFREKVIELSGEWAGWFITALANPSMRTVQEFASLKDEEAVNLDRIAALLGRVVTGWNFEENEGVPMSKPSEERIKDLPLDLVGEMMRAYVDGITQNPPA